MIFLSLILDNSGIQYVGCDFCYHDSVSYFIQGLELSIYLKSQVIGLESGIGTQLYTIIST